uniref:MIP22650p n=1 Tax=Drosophila melanogaster TaxID=7227 RepID=D6W4N0_DROME|nr:MIP22650p [Drosophila melanogaster]
MSCRVLPLCPTVYRHIPLGRAMYRLVPPSISPCVPRGVPFLTNLVNPFTLCEIQILSRIYKYKIGLCEFLKF